MRLDGVQPSWHTYGEAFSNCLLHKSLDLGQFCFRRMQSQGFHPTVS